MIARRDSRLNKHSVAFKVTEEEWQKLGRAAEHAGTTIARYAKRVIFEKLGLRLERPGKK